MQVPESKTEKRPRVFGVFSEPQSVFAVEPCCGSRVRLNKGLSGRQCAKAHRQEKALIFRAFEATAGFEPADEGFADPCLTTWRRRRKKQLMAPRAIHQPFVERETGFEPATLSLARRCSTTEPLPHMRCWLPPGRWRSTYPPHAAQPATSAETQDRTGDTAIFSRVLYQLSYLGGRRPVL